MSGDHNESGLADALDLALAKRGSAAGVLDREVADLVDLARALEAVACQVRPSDEFRASSRRHLMMHMARSARQQASSSPSVADRARRWAARFAAGLGALTIAGAAAASASASALPGDALYPVKQITEAAALQLAPNDSARQDVLLHQADTRLDETARLLQQGRDADAATTAVQYEQTLAALPGGPSADDVQPRLSTSQSRLSELLQTAPAPARAGLERALSATERHLKRAAEPEAVEPATTPAPSSSDTPQPTDAPETQPPFVRPASTAGPGEREHGNSAAHAAPASAERKDLPERTEPTPVTSEPEITGADHSVAPPPADIEKNHPAPHAEPQPPAAQPQGPAPARGGPASRPAPAGHGKP